VGADFHRLTYPTSYLHEGFRKEGGGERAPQRKGEKERKKPRHSIFEPPKTEEKKGKKDPLSKRSGLPQQTWV